MDGTFDLSFGELRCKEVINTADGRRLGRVVDIVFSSCGDIKGIVVPFCRRVFFARSQEVFVPFKCIDCIGEDVILVCLVDEGFISHPGRGGRFGHGSREYCPPEKGGGGRKHGGGKGGGKGGGYIRTHDADDDCCDDDDNKGGDFRAGVHTSDYEPFRDGPRCDKKCEKCMLFDCAYRWKS